jgi:hypothetical protein
MTKFHAGCGAGHDSVVTALTLTPTLTVADPLEAIQTRTKQRHLTLRLFPPSHTQKYEYRTDRPVEYASPTHRLHCLPGSAPDRQAEASSSVGPPSSFRGRIQTTPYKVLRTVWPWVTNGYAYPPDWLLRPNLLKHSPRPLVIMASAPPGTTGDDPSAQLDSISYSPSPVKSTASCYQRTQ